MRQPGALAQLAKPSEQSHARTPNHRHTIDCPWGFGEQIILNQDASNTGLFQHPCKKQKRNLKIVTNIFFDTK